MNNTAKPITIRSLSSASVGPAFTPLNPTGLTDACFSIRLVNASNQAIFISFNGLANHIYIPAGETFEFNGGSQVGQNASRFALIKKGTIFYVRGDAGTGTIYLSGFYQ